MPKPKQLFAKAGINQIHYNNLQRCFDYFNKELFENELPQTIITLRGKGCNGIYRMHSFYNKENESNEIDEISLNPNNLDRTNIEICSTLVHEMCHQYQCRILGETPKTYHDKTWASIMIDIGLMPSSTGEPGGLQTGNKMTHYILDNGKFFKTYMKMQKKLKLDLRRYPDPPKVKKKKKKANKTKYTCKICQSNVWGKPGLKLGCYCSGDSPSLLIEQKREEI